MRPLGHGTVERLGIWEHSGSICNGRLPCSPPPVRNLPSESLARLTIGQRDARLLALRESMFGPELTGRDRLSRVRRKSRTELQLLGYSSTREIEPAAELVVQSNGREVRFRLPTSADLLAVK